MVAAVPDAPARGRLGAVSAGLPSHSMIMSGSRTLRADQAFGSKSGVPPPHEVTHVVSLIRFRPTHRRSRVGHADHQGLGLTAARQPPTKIINRMQY